MDSELMQMSRRHEDVLKNLLQFYMYDFSEYTKADVEEKGLYADYPHLEDYWTEPGNRFPYLIKRERLAIGFAFVRFIGSGDSGYFSVAEFFIMRKYRRLGIGKKIAMQVFDLHKGRWKVYQMENNKPAQHFWKNIIGDYTKGRYSDRTENGRRVQEFTS